MATFIVGLLMLRGGTQSQIGESSGNRFTAPTLVTTCEDDQVWQLLANNLRRIK